MSEKKTGGPAFPFIWTDIAGNERVCEGASLRDYFAAMALSGLMTSYAEAKGTHEDLTIATPAICYSMADAMLAEREK